MKTDKELEDEIKRIKHRFENIYGYIPKGFLNNRFNNSIDNLVILSRKELIDNEIKFLEDLWNNIGCDYEGDKTGKTIKKEIKRLIKLVEKSK